KSEKNFVTPNKFSTRLLRLAAEDLRAISIYLESVNIHAGEKLLQRFDKQFEALEHHPFMGSLPDDEVLIRAGYRFLVIEKYMLFYTVEQEEVLVHRIFHTAQDYRPSL